MKIRIVLTGLLILMLSAMLSGQYLNRTTVVGSGIPLTGNLETDLLANVHGIQGFQDTDRTAATVMEHKYSPVTAGLFSAVIPGAGQFYTKSYLQSAAFFSTEVLAWVIYSVYENKGNRKTTAFQQYADQNWSVVRYADWININYGQSININQNSSLKPWQRVDWNDLNNAEAYVATLTDGQGNPNTGFTHLLASYGDQQYYEMIGKYSQFGGGWDDAAAYTKADVLANNGIGNVTQHFLDYRNMRGDANKFYNIATTVSYVIVANHILSALEAALNASKIDHRIELQGHIQSRRVEGNLVEFVPTLQVKYEL